MLSMYIPMYRYNITYNTYAYIVIRNIHKTREYTEEVPAYRQIYRQINHNNMQTILITIYNNNILFTCRIISTRSDCT